jgi:hypothetical protein
LKDAPDDADKTGVSIANDPANTGKATVTGIRKAGDTYEFDFTLPGNRTVTLKGGGTDTDGAVEGYAWECTKKSEGADVVPSVMSQVKI